MAVSPFWFQVSCWQDPCLSTFISRVFNIQTNVQWQKGTDISSLIWKNSQGIQPPSKACFKKKYSKLLTRWGPLLMSTQSQLFCCLFLLESYYPVSSRQNKHSLCLSETEKQQYAQAPSYMLFQANNIKAEASMKFQAHQFLICRLLWDNYEGSTHKADFIS